MRKAILTQKKFLNNGLQKFESQIAPYLLENGFEPIYHNHNDFDSLDYPFSQTVEIWKASRKLKKEAEKYDQIFLPAQNRLTVNPEDLDAQIVPYIHDIYPYTAHLYRENQSTFKYIVRMVQSAIGQEYMDNLVKLDKVIVSSYRTKKDLENRTSFTGNIEVVHQGVDGGLDEKPSIDDRDIDLLYVGTLRTRKNPEIIRKVFEKAHNKGYNVVSVNYEELDLPGEHYTDISEEKLRDLYSKTRYYLHPAFIEGFGRGAVEAQRHGAVPLGLDQPLNHEILGEEGETWIQIENTEDVMNIIDDEISQGTVEQAWENSKRFTWDKTRKQIKQALDKWNQE
ncbi:hypothetical protein GKQ38_04555 [Candidatus Nanohaloarchaea archaeon]|nr:hypothetical protein GKQ38_04555 [Candidatus Nanohaloarchaea archaeon]